MVKRWSPKPNLWVQVPFLLIFIFDYFCMKKKILIFQN